MTESNFTEQMRQLAEAHDRPVGTQSVAETIERTVREDMNEAYETAKQRIRDRIAAGDLGAVGYVPLAHTVLSFSPEEYDLSPYRGRARLTMNAEQRHELEFNRISGMLYYNYAYDSYLAEDAPSRQVRHCYRELRARAREDGIVLRLITSVDEGKCNVYIGYHFSLDGGGKGR